jgi:choline dehydrogenase-like flavoprotein
MTHYDAIVIGSGMSGGWNAKELAEKGLKVLVLERGQKIEPAKDYTDFLNPWDKPNFDKIPEDEIKQHYPIQHRGVGYAVKESTKHFWVKDSEHPYETPKDKPYDWLRGHHTGGRSLTWGRQSYRLGPQDFEANKQDGHGTDWPIRYDDLAPWYDYVEKFAGISGSQEGLPQLPDGVFQPAFELTCVEKAFKENLENAFSGRKVIPARVAHLTKPTEEQQALGRGPCQARNHCNRGCSFGAYFSANTATLPAAMRTGNCTIVNNAIVHSLDYDAETQRVTGVKVIDANTKELTTYTSRMVFLNASAIASAMILLQSKSDTFPNGLANHSDQVGRNLMDHVSAAKASGVIPEFDDKYYYGRRPGGIYIPRYANITESDKPYIRGFGFQGGSSRDGWTGNRPGIGADFKDANSRPGSWRISIYSFGEILPNPNNRVTLSKHKTDKWGLPLAYIDCEMGENEKIMMREAQKDAYAMLKKAGAKDISPGPDAELDLSLPGNRIHEMGTARMGRDPKTSVLNKWCQAHDVPNLFITDGACMPSAGCQNPSLTYMALSARAANHAVKLFKKGII